MTTEIDLRAVLNHYQQEHSARAGEQKARCPFHDDAHASMTINLGRGVWNCHACGVAGDAITYIKLKENCDYGTARSILDGISDADSASVRGGAGGQSSGYLPGITRNLRGGGRELPSWLRRSASHRT